jgi:pimeloyl-ACP methyl ester carboxylesterase
MLCALEGRDKIRLVIVGHSLGAGAGAIAAMEFHEHSFMKVEAVGFGCPGLLSRELSETTKTYITTVINDADIIPRMSGASMTNLVMDLIEYDWTEDALEDIGFSLERAREVFDFGKLLPDKDHVLKWVNDFMDKAIRPKFRIDKRERIPSLLIPPGTCIHLFRDGYGFSGTYMPCGHFASVEFSRNLVDDHMIGSGYQRAMLAVVQDMDRDYSVSSWDVLANCRTTRTPQEFARLFVT